MAAKPSKGGSSLASIGTPHDKTQMVSLKVKRAQEDIRAAK